MHDQRKTNYAHTLDFVPTPPWATRAFLAAYGLSLEHVSVLEPCVGRGHMADVLAEAGATVDGRDVKDYGWAGTKMQDFTDLDNSIPQVDWVITNPPFALAEDFWHRSMSVAKVGVVFHIRTTWLNGVGRWSRIFSKWPLDAVVMHAKNIPATQDKVIRRGSNQFNHSWLVWRKDVKPRQRFVMAPATAQTQFELDTDYD